MYGFADGDPVNFDDPLGLTPALAIPVAGAGVGIYIAGVGLIAAAAVLAEGDDLAAAMDAGVEAMGNAVQAVKGRIVEGQIRGQQKSVETHFTKLANPNQPGGNDPNNRDKWKRDIQRAIDIQKEKLKKLGEGDRRDRIEQLIKSNQDRLKGAQ